LPFILSILYDRIRWEEKTLRDKAKKKGIKAELIDAKSFPVDLSSKKIDKFGDIVLQRCIGYFRGLHFSAMLESKGISVINSFNTSLLCGDKLLTSLQLSKAGIPTPKTFVAFSMESALDAISEIGYPVVVKPIIGSWGRLVSLVKDSESAEVVFEHREMMNNSLLKIYYIQEFVKRPPRDIRIISMDDETVTAIYRSSTSNNWKTNVALGAKVSPCKITDEIEEIAVNTSKVLGGGILAIDAMESEDGILVHEVNSTIEFKGAATASGKDIGSKILDFVVRKCKN
jgi:[lysine-biosynthesis-protein LysW]--L-2-aminoadipate ligase